MLPIRQWSMIYCCQKAISIFQQQVSFYFFGKFTFIINHNINSIYNIQSQAKDMNKMTSKEYLIDITLISLDVGRLAKPASKVMCEIHYGDGDSYLRIKLQPSVKNGIALFYEERIRIPYSSEIALVFKMFRAKKQTFLGHYTIEIQKYLQQKVYAAKLKQKLEETDAWADFQVKIIDKQLFCNEESDDLQDEDLLPTNKSLYSQQQKSRANYSDYKAKSDFNTPFLIIKREQQMRAPPSPEQFSKLLLSVQDLLVKHRKTKNKNELLLSKEENVKSIKSSAIMRLQAHIHQAQQNQKINTYILWLCVALAGLFTGIVLKY